MDIVGVVNLFVMVLEKGIVIKIFEELESVLVMLGVSIDILVNCEFIVVYGNILFKNY